MNTLNRLVAVVELLIVIALMPIAIAAILIYPGILTSLNSNLGLNLAVGPAAVYSQAVIIGLAALVFVVAILLLFLELRRPSLRGLRVQQVSEGEVEVTPDAISHRLEQEIMQISDVTKVKPHVVAAGKGAVDLTLELETMPDVHVPRKTEEVITAAKQVMEERMGLKLGKIQVHVDHTRKGRRPGAEPAPAPAKAEEAPKPFEELKS